MPQQIDVPGQGVVEFPDGMSDTDIASAIQANAGPVQQLRQPDVPTDSMTRGAANYRMGQRETPDETSLSDLVTRPLAKVFPHMTARDVWNAQRAFLKSTSPFVDVTAGIPEPTDEELKKNTLLQIDTGASNAAGEFGNFFTSPLGIATLGTGALPAAAQRAIAGAFAVQMASQTPEQIKELRAAIKEGDVEKIANKATSLTANTLFAFKGGEHALKGERPDFTLTPKPMPDLDATAVQDLHLRDQAAQVVPDPEQAAAATPAETPAAPPAATPVEPVQTSDTPPPAAAAAPATVPEAPATIASQMQMLAEGKRPAVLVTPGAEMPQADPEHFDVTDTDAGKFITLKGSIPEEQIHAAVKENKIGDLLGYGIAAKPTPGTEVGAVTIRDPAGIEKQAVITDQAHLPAVTEAATKAASEGDQVALENPVKVINDRLNANEEARRKSNGSFVKWYPRADGISDVLDAIHEEGGIAEPKQSKFADQGDYDGYHEAFTRGMAVRLRRKDGGALPDELRDQLNVTHGFNFESTGEMYEAVQAAVEQRKGLRERQNYERDLLKQEEQRTVDFEDVALRNKGRSAAEKKATEAVPAGHLAIGDSFTLKGEAMKVTGYDPDTETYTVEDGRKFGSQQLHADAQFFPDKGSLKQSEEDPWAAKSMATPGAQPARAPRPGPTPPAPSPAPTAKTPLPPVAKLGAIRTWVQSQLRPFRAVLAPQSIDIHARTVANMVREYSGKAAVDLARADEAMAEYRKDFDTTPVRRGWKYDPAQPLPRNYAFLDAAERNRGALSPEHQQLVSLFDDMFAGRIQEIQRLQPAAMQNLIADYFPHIWKDPKAAMDYTASVTSKSPLHGDKSFLKQRSIPYILDGLKRGLEPVSDNPIDLLLIKLHQMDKFILAERTLTEATQRGYRKYISFGQKRPDGWTQLDDPSSTRYGPPVVTFKEAYDAGIRRGLLDFIQKMGFTHTRTAKLPINVWGQYQPGAGAITSRVGSPDLVIMHELGHGLDEKYDLSKVLAATPRMQTELTELAKFRHQGVPSDAKFRKYVQQMDEKMANALHAYLYAPELMEQVAPNVKEALRNFISIHPELHDLNDIKPSLTLQAADSQLPLPGYTVMGHYYMPDSAAQVLKNYLSPGLARYSPYRNLRAASNLINAAQLGLSAFHLGFTSLDAGVSSVAVGLRELSTMDPGAMLTGAKRILTSPVAPVSNYYLGKAVQRAMIEPGSKAVNVLGFKYGLSSGKAAEVNEIAKLAITAGLRATLDPFYKTEVTRKLTRAFHEGGVEGYAKTALQLPFAIVEQTMRPIAEFLVPRQKLGVFAQMALGEMQRLGPGADHLAIRDAMAKAADSTENRMGQMTYDNLFYNKIVKDVALIGFRAYGWQLGKYRESIGALADTASQAKRLATGNTPELTHRMAYVVALPMVVAALGGITHYLMNGKAPESTMDYFFPRTGQLDRDGRPQRLMLPSYLKDLASDWHDFPDLKKMGESFYHKLNPWIGMTVDMLRNRDFYGTEIRHPDDPALRQGWDLIKYALNEAKPFSITGMQKLKEDDASPAQYALPFFGIVSAKKSLTMTPAESKAADIMQETMPSGSRTKEQFDHGQLIKTLVRDLKVNPVKGATNLQAAAAGGQVKENDVQKITSMLALKPLQYQVHKMGADNAMRIWDLANPAERQQIQGIIAVKLAGAKDLDPETRARYLSVLFGAKPVKKPTP